MHFPDFLSNKSQDSYLGLLHRYFYFAFSQGVNISKTHAFEVWLVECGLTDYVHQEYNGPSASFHDLIAAEMLPVDFDNLQELGIDSDLIH